AGAETYEERNQYRYNLRISEKFFTIENAKRLDAFVGDRMRASLHVMISKKLDFESFDKTDDPAKWERPRDLAGPLNL
ncbi:MAG: hypothetical protein ACKO6O_00305, partial [Acidimicrobiaceae bacterium]